MEQVPTSSSGTGRRGGCIWDSRLVTTRLNNEGICSGIRIACRGFTSGSFNCIFKIIVALVIPGAVALYIIPERFGCIICERSPGFRVAS